jgi:hypothetical protein
VRSALQGWAWATSMAYLVSLGHFAWETVKRWWLSVVGVGFAALGVLQAGFGVSVSIPTPAAFGGAAATWFLAAGWAYHDLRMKQLATSAVWQILDPLMHEGSGLLDRLWSGNMGDWMGDAQAWVVRAAEAIGRETDMTEATLFRQAGEGKNFETQVREKVEYLRDKIQPKAREGYWP